MVVKKKKTVKVEAVDLEEEKLQMLMGNFATAPPKIYLFLWVFSKPNMGRDLRSSYGA